MKVAFLACAFLGAAACVKVDGGAVEVSWVVRTDDGRAITDCGCTDPRVQSVRLNLRRTDDGSRPCDGRAECQFDCQRGGGATAFDVAPGSYAISLTPLDSHGDDLTMATDSPVHTPAPILRDVVHGQPAEIETFLLVVARCASNCSGSSGTGVCTKQ